MKPNPILKFVETHWKTLHRFTLAASVSRFRQFGRHRKQLINSQDPADVASRVLTKLCTQPFTSTPEELSLESLKHKLRNLVNTEVHKLIKQGKARPTEARDPTEIVHDEQYFDWVLSEYDSDEERRTSHQLIEDQGKQIDDLLVKYESTDVIAYFVLYDWTKGKSMEETATNNGLTLTEVMNARKRVRRALR